MASGPPALAPGTTRAYATIGRRFVARLTDGLLFAAPAFVLLVPYIDTASDDVSFDPPVWLLAAITLASLVSSYSGIRALLPTVAGAVPVAGLFLWSGIYLVDLFTPRRQGIHDYAAGTIVVSLR
jgi:uncharacterized RDD family membrane protein YckC